MPTYGELIARGDLLDDDEEPREAPQPPKLPAKLRAIAKAPRTTDPDSKARNRRKHLRAMLSQFNRDEAWYEEQFARQGGKCAICRQASSEHLVIDHCHGGPGIERRYESLRSLLCNPCNRGLGAFRDDADRLEAAARYLRGHRKRLDAANDQ